MKIKKASDDVQNMSQSGDAILKSLQNTDFSLTDIIVRESLQNALDASRRNSEQTRVDFVTGEFRTGELNHEFEGIAEKLDELYDGTAEFLAISDRNTCGLDGSYDPKRGNELYRSNFYKLVFGLGKNQEGDGAGGSWGLGKTSYFRAGAGIVIYYTRVENGEGYEERLIASLIENPKSADRLLEDNARGIAWWGRYRKNDDENIYPVTKHENIAKIMDVFGLSCYGGDETGTTIIIPYLKKFVETSSNPWGRNLERSLETAVQRWYAPRLMNAAYHEETNNASLLCSVDGRMVELRKPFRLLQELYTAALTGKTDSRDITVSDVTIPRAAMDTSRTRTGRIAFTVMDIADAVDGGYTYRQYIENTDGESEGSYKVVAFARKPGMVVRYDFDGDWSKGVVISENQCLIGFFVPNSGGLLYEKYRTDKCYRLEQYLRNGEKADHADWFDDSGITLVRRMKKETAKAIGGAVDDGNGRREVSVSEKLARKFGYLLPPDSYGKSGRNGRRRIAEPNGKHDRTASVVIDGIDMDDDGMLLVNFSATMKHGARAEIGVETQNQLLNQEKWSRELGGIPFPFVIRDVSLDNEDIAVRMDDVYRSAFEMTNPGDGMVHVSGRLQLEMLSDEYQPQLNVQQIKKKEAE